MSLLRHLQSRRTDGFSSGTFRPHRRGVREVELFGGGAWITRTTGEGQDGDGFVGGGIQWESGERLAAFVSRAVSVLDESFDLADRIPVLPGTRYDRMAGTVFLRSSQSRPLSLFGVLTGATSGTASSPPPRSAPGSPEARTSTRR